MSKEMTIPYFLQKDDDLFGKKGFTINKTIFDILPEESKEKFSFKAVKGSRIVYDIPTFAGHPLTPTTLTWLNDDNGGETNAVEDNHDLDFLPEDDEDEDQL